MGGGRSSLFLTDLNDFWHLFLSSFTLYLGVFLGQMWLLEMKSAGTDQSRTVVGNDSEN